MARYIGYVFLCTLLTLVVSCGQDTETTPSGKTIPPAIQGPADQTAAAGKKQVKREPKPWEILNDREKEAYQSFEEILKLIQSGDPDRTRIESLYLQIINNFQETVLAEECYYRLTKFYLQENSAENYRKSVDLYNQYLSRYPKQQFRKILAKELQANSHYSVESLGETAPLPAQELPADPAEKNNPARQ